MIKIFVHYNSLLAFKKGRWINARMQFVGPNDVELFLDINKIDIAYQQQGFTVRKKSFLNKLLRR